MQVAPIHTYILVECAINFEDFQWIGHRPWYFWGTILSNGRGLASDFEMSIFAVSLGSGKQINERIYNRSKQMNVLKHYWFIVQRQ